MSATARLHPAALVAAAWLALAGCAASPAASQRVYQGDYGPRYDSTLYAEPEEGLPFQVDALIGSRSMRADDLWAPLENQIDLGVALRAPLLRSEFLSFDSGVRYAFDSTTRAGTKVSTQTIELDAGLVLNFTPPGSLVQPYIGAGVSVLFVDFEIEPDVGASARDREAGLGRYVRGGLAVEFSPAQLIGIELRYLDGGDANLAGRGASVDSFGAALSFGARF